MSEGNENNNSEKKENQVSNSKDAEDLPRDSWLVRPCNTYIDEYKDCTSRRGRFHQRFVYGEELDCTKWKESYDYCQTYRQTRDKEALKKLLAIERQRYKDRLKQSLGNDIWEHRTKPPNDWNSPMPESWMEERKHTLLAAYQNDDERNVELLMRRRCVIL